MTSETDPDEQLVGELRAFFAEVDPVPPLVIELATASLGWRRLDAELAELLSDSALEEESVALARSSGAAVRAVTFGSGELTIDLEVHSDDHGRTLLGQLSPPVATTIEVQTATDAPASAEAQADRLGRFRVRLPSGGPIRLRVLGEGGSSRPPVETSWITV